MKSHLTFQAETGEESQYDLAGRVIGLAMKVHNTLGPGFVESVYQQALTVELKKAELAFESQKALHVIYENTVAGEFVADFLIAGELIIELKAVQALVVAHEIQTVNYLTATGTEFGLLINFGAERLEFKKKFRRSRNTPRLPPPPAD